MKEKIISISVTVITTLIIAGLTAYFTFFKSLYEQEIQMTNLSNKIDAIVETYNSSNLPNIESVSKKVLQGSDGLIFIESFNNSMSGWIKNANSFENSIQNGAYMINAKSKEYVYSTLPIEELATKEAFDKYSLELSCTWISADKNNTNLPFGLLLYKNQNNLLRFEITKSGEAMAMLKNKGIQSTVIGKRSDLDVSKGDVYIRINKINSDFEFFINNKSIGKFKAVGFNFSNIGVFLKGKQTVKFNSLTAKNLANNK
jgi:hypothetical protein